ncbi:hypothetical protein PsYK624_148180 [Phanerochaete sordida]|uniref:Uncharacterized protein n=1 Tax=Phanerochaete sordida TaxID=48140 RepID=A0A9P3GN99_9APHY|nr:hypothetical protein PsYK624_148180 [Phanerochaete sordida]
MARPPPVPTLARSLYNAGGRRHNLDEVARDGKAHRRGEAQDSCRGVINVMNSKLEFRTSTLGAPSPSPPHIMHRHLALDPRHEPTVSRSGICRCARTTHVNVFRRHLLGQLKRLVAMCPAKPSLHFEALRASEVGRGGAGWARGGGFASSAVEAEHSTHLLHIVGCLTALCFSPRLQRDTAPAHREDGGMRSWEGTQGETGGRNIVYSSTVTAPEQKQPKCSHRRAAQRREARHGAPGSRSSVASPASASVVMSAGADEYPGSSGGFDFSREGSFDGVKTGCERDKRELEFRTFALAPRLRTPCTCGLPSSRTKNLRRAGAAFVSASRAVHVDAFRRRIFAQRNASLALSAARMSRAHPAARTPRRARNAGTDFLANA